MTPQSNISCSQCAERIHRCQKMVADLNLGRITVEEFGYNFAVCLVKTCDSCIQAAVDALPIKTAENTYTYLRTLFVPTGFMIDPQIFIAGKASDEQIEEMKEQLATKYMHLLNTLRNRTS